MDKQPEALSLVETHRLANLRRIVKEAGGPKGFVQKIGQWSPSYISQLAGPNPTRSITEVTAREIEEKYGLPTGELDQPPPEELATSRGAAIGGRPPRHDSKILDREIFSAALQLVAELVEQYENDAFNPGRHGKIVALVYEDAIKKGSVDYDYAEDLIDIASRR